MTGIQLATTSPFDSIKQPRGGEEFWSARQLMPFLGYARWNEFREAIHRAQLACANSGHDVSQHFSATTLKTPGRPAEDIEMTRFGCYLTGMAGDPRKTEIASAQTYFAVQTRRAEVAQQLPALPADPLLAQLQVITQMRQDQLQLASRTEQLEQRLDASPITSEKVGVIYKLAKELGSVMGDYRTAWRIFKNHYNLASYRDLPSNRYEEAVRFLQMQIAAYTGQPRLDV
ncbi:hypothetical protein Q0M94_28405 (plasmid) [Deinococcus radiomollis]|uniref:BRO family protein n=1 Tax=Deinococcus radiomollis TaxID=468916 RepID=UPI0038924AFE